LAPARCPGCGAAIADGSHFCPGCGQPLGDKERPRQPGEGGGWVESIDKAWNFFSSTKVGTVLVGTIAAASVLGSLVEQEHLYQDWRPPHLYYPDRYGEFWGNLYMQLGLTHAYSSVWFATLILMLIISLIVASLHRGVPLYKMLTRPQVWKLPHFLRRQPLFTETEGTLAEVEAKLKKRGYKIIRDRECLYAERGRLSRWGAYTIHVGLLIVCFAAMSKAIPGWNETRDVWVPDGQTVKVPETNFAITNHKFTMELHPNGAPARFATDAAVVQNGEEVVRRTIEVNHPLTYQGWDIYQASWREEPGIAHLKVVTEMGVPVGDVTLDLRHPETEYKVTDTLKLVVSQYFHDFVLDPESGQPTNASFEVNNPTLLGEFVNDKGEVLGRVALPVLAKEKVVYQGAFALQVEQVDIRWYTALKLHKDKTVPFMFAGLAIVLLGMYVTFFLFHWQLWVREENGTVLVGARAHKNKFGLKKEIQRLLGSPIGEGTLHE
jgi:cytochrome c biogenesis protein